MKDKNLATTPYCLSFILGTRPSLLLASGGHFDEQNLLQLNPLLDMFIAEPKSNCFDKLNYLNKDILDHPRAGSSGTDHKL